MNEIQDIADRYGLSLDDLRSVLQATDAARGLVTPAEVEQGLANVVAVYIGCLSSAAERVADPAERLVVGRFVHQVVELLSEQLSAAPHRPN